MQGPCREIYKNLLKDIKENLNKWRNILSMVRKAQFSLVHIGYVTLGKILNLNLSKP